MNDAYISLGKKIIEAQKELEKLDSHNDLLHLINIDNLGIHRTEEFLRQYKIPSVYESLEKYINDLQEEIKKKK